MKQNWNLSSIYPDETAFEKDEAHAKARFNYQGDLETKILSVQEGAQTLRQLSAFVDCSLADDPTDTVAQTKAGRLSDLNSLKEKALFSLGMELKELDDAAFDALTAKLSKIAFCLKELREDARRKKDASSEELINALSSDGYHSHWGLYHAVTGKIRVGEKQLSIGQAYNLLSDPDRKVRLKAFEEWTTAWQGQADVLAKLLNAIGGFRLKVYEARGWEDVLYEPLLLNRMEKATLDAMWTAIDNAKPTFLRYLERKKELLGLKELHFVDVEAPLGKSEKISYEKGAEDILQQFEKFHPKMAEFSRFALENGWIEAEDRIGKAAGGFCVMLPKTRESRIFMTYKGTPLNVATLAHELGHGYHNKCVENLPYFSQDARMNVAETASTFGEMIVVDQSIAAANTPEEKKQLLDDKLQRSVVYFMNLQFRFQFEAAFYEERKRGFVSVERLSSLMLDAQKKCFCNVLSSYDPLFWASKLHFFFTDFPFYNFPYTFGYLMSNGLYARAKKERGFGEKFDAFLEDTARMNVEDLGKKHLGVDLTRPDFWEESLALLEADVEEFLSL